MSIWHAFASGVGVMAYDISHHYQCMTDMKETLKEAVLVEDFRDRKAVPSRERCPEVVLLVYSLAVMGGQETAPL